MKSQQARTRTASELDRAWQVADADVAAHIQQLFARCPELCGFSVQAKVQADVSNLPGEEELFVTAISIAPRLSKEQYTEIFEQITVTLMELIGERPEAQSLLRGRTFARVIH